MIAANDTWQGIVGNRWPYSKGLKISKGFFMTFQHPQINIKVYQKLTVLIMNLEKKPSCPGHRDMDPGQEANFMNNFYSNNFFLKSSNIFKKFLLLSVVLFLMGFLIQTSLT